MLAALDEQLADAKTSRLRMPRLRMPMAKELLQRQIDATDRQIDRLGY